MTDNLTETTSIRSRTVNPSVLGLYALGGTTFVVGAHMAGWYGTGVSPHRLAPFALAFGIVQLLAATWSWARGDDLATALLGIWGAFWLGYGILGVPPGATAPAGAPELAFWLIVAAAFTWIAALAAVAERRPLAVALVVLAAGATLGAIGEGIDSHGVRLAAGWVFAIAGVLTWYLATAMLLAASGGRRLLPLPRGRGVQPAPPEMRRAVPNVRGA